MGRLAHYRRFACPGGVLRATFGSDVHLFAKPQLVQAIVAGHVVATTRVPPAAETTMRVRLRRRGNVCNVTLRVPHTRVPGAHDRRHLGVRVVALS